MNALVGTATYTYPTAFSQTPVIVTTSGPTGVATSVSTTAVTITGAGQTSFVILEGY